MALGTATVQERAPLTVDTMKFKRQIRAKSGMIGDILARGEAPIVSHLTPNS